MKMGTTPSLWRYDVGAYDTPLLAENAKACDYALRSVTAMGLAHPVTMYPTCDHAAVRGMAEVPQ